MPLTQKEREGIPPIFFIDISLQTLTSHLLSVPECVSICQGVVERMMLWKLVLYVEFVA